MLEGPVHVRYELTREDVADLARVTRRSQRWVLAGYTLAIVALVGLILALDLGRDLALSVGAFLLAGLLLMLWQAARSRRADVGAVLTLELSPSGVSYESGRQSGRFPWAGVEVRPKGRVLVLARGGRPVLAVHARALSPSDLAAVAAWSAPAAQVSAGPDADSDAGDSVQERPDGEIVVRGRLTPARARAITHSTVRPAVRRGLNLLAAAAVVLAWASTVPRLRMGEGPTADVVILTVVMGAALGLAGLSRLLILWQLRSRVGGGRLEWRYSSRGVTTVSAVGESFAEWWLVRDAVVQRDMLVVHRKGSMLTAGYLLGPLSAEQRRRVLAWVEAGSGKRVVGGR